MDYSGMLKAAAILAFTFFYAHWFGGRIPYFIFYTTMGILVIGFIWSRMSRNVAAVCTIGTPTAQVGEKARFVFEVTNNTGWPVPWLQYWVQMPETMGFTDNLVCYTFSLAPHEKKVVSDEFECKIRGYHEWGNGLIRTGDLFGVFSHSLQVGQTEKLMVLPHIYDLWDEVAAASGRRMGDNPANFLPGRGGTGFVGVRKYEAGDGIARIHWKASARTQHLLVKEFQDQKLLDLMLYLDLSAENHAGAGPDSSLEMAVSLAASIAGAGLRAGYGMGLAAFGLSKTVIPVGYGKTHFNLLLQTLVGVKAGSGFLFSEILGAETAQLKKGCQAHVITGGLDERLVESLLRLKTGGQNNTVFLIRPESFGDKKVDHSARDNSVSRLKAFGINVFEIDKSSDLRLIFRGL